MKRKLTHKVINFDMDGTLANFYAVPNWLNLLRSYDASPYEKAKPLFDFRPFARVVNKLQKNGYTINIISWGSAESNPQFDLKVRLAKLNWLAKHLPSVKFDNVYIVPYGTPKHSLASGYLFDDNAEVRDKWGFGAKNVFNITEDLKALL